MLLKAFPGKTLEELDGMDWGRWQRAREAQWRLDIEGLRAKSFAGNADMKSLPQEVLDVWREHDALIGEEGDDGSA